ncbi:MAG TPA: hypothetical protein VJT50_14510 [Pyrinomonadaceae bacterium]|nr:hypothetical protein [Pyrinomonadaceae bacterium]
MKPSTVKSFSKKLACPSSNLLLSFNTKTLTKEINFLVKHHLKECDFCYCEIPLLMHYRVPAKVEARAPELPINLRILAESILLQSKARKVKTESKASEKGFTVIDLTEAEGW